MLAAARGFVVLAGALAVTLTLFWAMRYLVFGAEMVLADDERRPPIQIVRIKRDSETRIRKRTLPNRSQPEPPPETPKVDRSAAQTKGAIAIGVEAPALETRLDLKNALQLGAAPSDSEEAPLIRVNPIYPPRALSQGLEGFVLVQFDITASGATTNVKVIDSKPKGVFDRAAVRAVRKWKYRPRVVDGKALAKTGIRVNFPFTME